MLYITDTNDQTIWQGHTGEKTPELSISSVAEVQADGDELLVCLRLVGRTTPSKMRVYCFVGDEARTIFRNWNNYK